MPENAEKRILTGAVAALLHPVSLEKHFGKHIILSGIQGRRVNP
jgi:hypothetical protein